MESNFNISGYILDDDTGAPVRNASVYDRLLISTLTDDNGFFKLKIKSINEGAAINLIGFSRNGYKQLSVYTDDNLITTVAYKSGNAKLYTNVPLAKDVAVFFWPSISLYDLG